MLQLKKLLFPTLWLCPLFHTVVKAHSVCALPWFMKGTVCLSISLHPESCYCSLQIQVEWVLTSVPDFWSSILASVGNSWFCGWGCRSDNEQSPKACHDFFSASENLLCKVISELSSVGFLYILAAAESVVVLPEVFSISWKIGYIQYL